jgi:hypothetical protein
MWYLSTLGGHRVAFVRQRPIVSLAGMLFYETRWVLDAG